MPLHQVIKARPWIHPFSSCKCFHVVVPFIPRNFAYTDVTSEGYSLSGKRISIHLTGPLTSVHKRTKSARKMSLKSA